MIDKNKKGLILKMVIASKGKGGPTPGSVDSDSVGQYAIDDPTKAAANMDSGMPKHHDGKGGPGYMKKGKGGPGAGPASDPSMNPSIPGLDSSSSPMAPDPTQGGSITPAGSTPITPTNPSATPPPGGAPSLLSTIAPLPKLRAGMGKSLKPSRFSGVKASASASKSAGAKKTSAKKEALQGAIRKMSGTAGKSPSPMSSMKKLPSFK